MAAAVRKVGDIDCDQRPRVERVRVGLQRGEYFDAIDRHRQGIGSVPAGEVDVQPESQRRRSAGNRDLLEQPSDFQLG